MKKIKNGAKVIKKFVQNDLGKYNFHLVLHITFKGIILSKSVYLS